MPLKDLEARKRYQKEHRKQWTPEQRAQHNKKCSEYQKAHRAERSAYQRKWIAENRKKKSAYSVIANRKWKERHPEEAKRRDKIQYERHFLRIKTHCQRRKARLRGAEGSHTLREWLEKVIVHRWLCFYCKNELTIETLTKEHFIPIVRGGRDDIANIVPACLHCNCSKSAMTGDEFIQYRKDLNRLRTNQSQANPNS